MQSKIDDLFRKSLYNSMSGFGNDYSQISDENQKIFYYIETASDLKAAIDLALSTSYNEKNKHLYPSIYYLYTCMINSSTSRLLISERENIYMYLSEIAENPLDVQKSKMLEDLTSKILFDNKE